MAQAGVVQRSRRRRGQTAQAEYAPEAAPKPRGGKQPDWRGPEATRDDRQQRREPGKSGEAEIWSMGRERTMRTAAHFSRLSPSWEEQAQLAGTQGEGTTPCRRKQAGGAPQGPPIARAGEGGGGRELEALPRLEGHAALPVVSE